MDNVKEATNLVDIILDGDYRDYKKIRGVSERVDTIIDELENKLQNAPDQDLSALHKTLYDELTKDSLHSKSEETMGEALEQLLGENQEEYRAYFKSMMKKWNITSPSQLDTDKRKKFFDAVDKGWKAKNE